MKRLLASSLLILLSGCSLMQPPIESAETIQGTTTVDAVEGDKSESNSGLTDALRNRTDPVAGDPAWAPIHPKVSLSITRRKRARCLIWRAAVACMTILNRVVWVTSLP